MCGRDILWGWRGSARAVNPLLPKCLQGQSFGADMEGVNLSKPCCSVAPGGLYGKAPPLWHEVLCPPWQDHLPCLVPTFPPPACSRLCRLPLTQAHLLIQVKCHLLWGSFPEWEVHLEQKTLPLLWSPEFSNQECSQVSCRPESLGLSLGSF